MGNSTVKFVFRTLLATVLTLVLGALTIEYINLTITSYNVRDAIETSLYNACNSFNQESYRSKALTDIDAIDVADVDRNAGTVNYASGDVYGVGSDDFYSHFYSNVRQESNGIYRGSVNREYYEYLTQSDLVKRYDSKDPSEDSVANIYSDLGDFCNAYRFIKSNGSGFENVEIRTSQYTSIASGLNMMDNEYTPMNLNAVYVGMDGSDKGNAYEAVNNLFEWNLTQIWSNCTREMRHVVNGTKYVERSGWRIYTDTAKITEIEYYAYNVNNDEALEEFSKISNISGHYYTSNAYTYGSGNQYVMAVRMSYEVAVQYVGITPWARIMNWAMGIGDQDYGNVERDYTLNGSDSGTDITRAPNESEYKDAGTFYIKTEGGNGRNYYVWYYNIT